MIKIPPIRKDVNPAHPIRAQITVTWDVYRVSLISYHYISSGEQAITYISLDTHCARSFILFFTTLYCQECLVLLLYSSTRYISVSSTYYCVSSILILLLLSSLLQIRYWVFAAPVAHLYCTVTPTLSYCLTDASLWKHVYRIYRSWYSNKVCFVFVYNF